ncbi:MAG: conjugal transfer protein TraX [Clostridiales Family XIII bacterium]|jgi:hypothetical protein|nr:conjugal transfer protein TraX [Clostridiales Family XIII bacterium]
MAAAHMNGLNTNQLKIWAVVTMVIDHFPYISQNVHAEYYEFPFYLFHLIGRIAAPIFFYLAAAGYSRTRNPNRYTLRLLVFALISYVPYVWYFKGAPPNAENFMELNVIFTMLFGVLILRAIHEIGNVPLKIGVIAFCLIVGYFTDYGIYGLAFIIAFSFAHGRKGLTALLFALVVIVRAVYELSDVFAAGGAGWAWFLADPQNRAYLMVVAAQFLPLILILLHRDIRRSPEPRPGAFGKWFFYVFYPLHISVFLIIRVVMAPSLSFF